MILYQLRCAAGHEFEGWFRNSATYDDQAAAGSVTCPVCGDTRVAKAPMAPRIARSGTKAAALAAESAPVPAPVAGAPVPAAPAPLPAPAAQAVLPVQAELMTKLRELRRMVEASAENVGGRFADEARKIHNGEAEARPIYGDTTPEEAEALTDEGVPFARIPWVPPHDS